MTGAAESAAQGFHDWFGRRAAGVWSAPGRVNLIGEHTDYNEGFVFPFAIDRRTAVAVGDRDDRVIRVTSTVSTEPVSIDLDRLSPEAVGGMDWAAYPLGVVWALVTAGAAGVADGDLRGADLHITSEVPIGAGLSSSAAIECSVALALAEHWRVDLDRTALARVGQLAENAAVGAPTGIMDQLASMLGRADAGVFIDCRSLDAEPIPLRFAEAGLEVLVVDTRVSHAHATGGYAARRASCEAGAARLGVGSLRDLGLGDLPRAAALLDDETFRRVRHVVTENQRVLDTVRTLHEHGPAAIGALLDASHASMRDDFEISTPELDLAVAVARDGGAVGARMTGGGFGGSAIALVPSDGAGRISAAVSAAFAEAGHDAPSVFTVQAADGARREF